ncbi:MAG: AAA family ATPase, partial [Deltaproteobacteria bacterium]|nr:AAA family ATPase [Deltaproteobacteria bacterium]
MAEKIHSLAPERLRWRCDPDQFSFKTTDDISPLDEIIGQARAMHSLDMGLGMKSHGYNIYVLGESGTGKSSIIKAQLERVALNEETPNDWCYIFNFLDPDIPKALTLPAGIGSSFKTDMDELVFAIRTGIPQVFDTKDYERHRDEVYEGQQERTKSILSRMEQQAEERGFVLQKSASGLSVMPAKD